MSNLLLSLSCQDRVGLLSEVTGFCASKGLNLLEAHQFTDLENSWFFTRLEVAPTETFVGFDNLYAEATKLGQKLRAFWHLRKKSDIKRVAIMVSKNGHCLADLLWRWSSGELPMKLVGVISNHLDHQNIVEREKLPFVHIPIFDKATSFAAVKTQLEAWKVDTIVLARYMQVLPPEICARWNNKIINIHHSFLPAFVGAQPYHQAHLRGVKLIGATCHYVNNDLDAGPILDQEVARVTHAHTVHDMIKLGQDCERLALFRGLQSHLEDRVFVHNGRTIIFKD